MKRSDVLLYPFYFFSTGSEALPGFLESVAGYIEDGNVGKALIKQEVCQPAVSAAYIYDPGGFGEVEAMNEVQRSDWYLLGPTDLLGRLGAVDFFPMIFVLLHKRDVA